MLNSASQFYTAYYNAANTPSTPTDQNVLPTKTVEFYGIPILSVQRLHPVAQFQGVKKEKRVAEQLGPDFLSRKFDLEVEV